MSRRPEAHRRNLDMSISGRRKQIAEYDTQLRALKLSEVFDGDIRSTLIQRRRELSSDQGFDTVAARRLDIARRSGQMTRGVSVRVT